ncbi:type IX secretion system protein PorG [Brumimicrobium aurantiacum]|uniref:DUF6089 domain-containing protein n=1 Tax=Brumimicrobium aurantiacum TaxID=1737063 RepID=A0A3E1EVE7_9FLAO|nr:DUF6089 family protein [Brumimicrobium aurantiacum]RFC53492.1 hypothetical protein DXU93_12040 [Brumimicrobium aurantiacum]
MTKFKLVILIGLILFGANQVNAQLENFRSKSSIGVIVGGSYYIGDLNKYDHFKNTNLSFGLIYRYHVNSRLELRTSLRYGRVEAYDSESERPDQIARNLSFESPLYEVTGGLEFNYLNYKLGNKDYFFTPYMFIDIGLFKMNPQTEYNGEMVELQTIGTEGQNSDLTEKNSYSLTQLVVPFGVGFKINLGERAAFSLEYGIRKTFTDYLDDVGKGVYLNRTELAEQNGNIAAVLSDRSPSDIQMTGQRGNAETKDWYSMFGVMLTFSLGNPDICYYR